MSCSFTSYEQWTKRYVRIYLLVVDENGYDPFLTKSKELIMDENGYVRGPTRILRLLVLDENGYDFFPHEG